MPKAWLSGAARGFCYKLQGQGSTLRMAAIHPAGLRLPFTWVSPIAPQPAGGQRRGSPPPGRPAPRLADSLRTAQWQPVFPEG